MISPAPTWEPPTGDGGNEVLQAVDQLSVQGPDSYALVKRRRNQPSNAERDI